MVKTTFSKIFGLYDYSDLIENNYILDANISSDKDTIVFINNSEGKLIIISDGLHFRSDGYSKLLPFLLDKEKSYILKIKEIVNLCINLLKREGEFKETIKRVEDKYPNIKKYIIGYSFGGMMCAINKEKIIGYQVITLNSPIINKTNNNYCSHFDIVTLLFSKLCYNSDSHNTSNMLLYDVYKLSRAILEVLENGNYIDLLITLHDPCNINNDEIIII
jgi:hypothetical protein